MTKTFKQICDTQATEALMKRLIVAGREGEASAVGQAAQVAGIEVDCVGRLKSELAMRASVARDWEEQGKLYRQR